MQDAPSVWSVSAFHPVFAQATRPIDVASRRESLLGLAAIVFRLKPVVQGAMRGIVLDDLAVALIDVDSPSTASRYESSPGALQILARNPRELWQRAFPIAGRNGSIAVGYAGRGSSESQSPWLILAAGLVGSVLAAALSRAAQTVFRLRRQVSEARRLGQYTRVQLPSPRASFGTSRPQPFRPNVRRAPCHDSLSVVAAPVNLSTNPIDRMQIHRWTWPRRLANFDGNAQLNKSRCHVKSERTSYRWLSHGVQGLRRHPARTMLGSFAALLLATGSAGAGKARAERPDPRYPVRVIVRELKNRTVEGAVRQHKLYVDQPKAFGGDDTAPTPPETLAFALGSCVVSTARLLAMQRQLTVREISATIDGELDFARALGISTKERAGFAGLSIRVTLDAEMTDAEKSRFLREVGARCPMCDNLTNATPVAIEPAIPPQGSG